MPHAGVENARIGRVHDQIGAASVGRCEEDARPGDATVGGAIHAAFLLRSVRRAQGAREHHIGIGRMHHDARDAPGLLKSHQLPGATCIGGLVDALTDGDMAPDVRLAGARPHDVVVAGCNRQRAD